MLRWLLFFISFTSVKVSNSVQTEQCSSDGWKTIYGPTSLSSVCVVLEKKISIIVHSGVMFSLLLITNNNRMYPLPLKTKARCYSV